MEEGFGAAFAKGLKMTVVYLLVFAVYLGGSGIVRGDVTARTDGWTGFTNQQVSWQLYLAMLVAVAIGVGGLPELDFFRSPLKAPAILWCIGMTAMMFWVPWYLGLSVPDLLRDGLGFF